MKLILCPPGYIGVRIAERDIFIDKRIDEQRGYALVCDKDAKFLVNRGGYEEVPMKQYPRSLEWLERKSKMTLCGEGIIARATAEAHAAQKSVPIVETPRPAATKSRFSLIGAIRGLFRR